jgi:uncharacterized protein YlzI (FlbEa/FlbD family)
MNNWYSIESLYQSGRKVFVESTSPIDAIHDALLALCDGRKVVHSTSDDGKFICTIQNGWKFVVREEQPAFV